MEKNRDLANAVRFLAADAVQQANSGHPGMPMGMADIAEVLWNDFLSHNPNNPNWVNRDRFILSNGHGAMLQYALLHLSGYDLSINDLKQFRQLHSKTPGHPESFETPGVDTTTGPLGQGLANGVGMAIAEKVLSAEFNQPGYELINHYTYVFAGDGCLMEGVSHEVCSLAGTLELGKLIVFWDDNHISIDGDTKGWFTVNVPEQFRAYGWQVITDVDGHDRESIKKAILKAQEEKNKPTLIACRTIIGYGSPNKAGSADVHGAPLGADEVLAMRKQLNWDYAPFMIPDSIYAAWDAKIKGAEQERLWQQQYEEYAKSYPELAALFERRQHKKLPNHWHEACRQYLETLASSDKAMATRKSSQLVIEKLTSLLPEMIGGSADLTCSNLTDWPTKKVLTSKTANANYIYYGVREFGMAAIMNGIALHGGFIPFGGTFLVFQSYCANATRMSALMRQQVIYVFTHDSIGLGEDGPTHQPIAEAATLRLTPNMSVWRPCDTTETFIAWQHAIERTTGPTALLLSRQNLPQEKRSLEAINSIHRGGYILDDVDNPDLVLIATGSEVSLARAAAQELALNKIYARVISMPSVDVFMAQDQAYRDQVLPPSLEKRIAIEASAADYWYRLVGLKGRVIGMSTFGASAPLKDILKAFGFTVEHICQTATELFHS